MTDGNTDTSKEAVRRVWIRDHPYEPDWTDDEDLKTKNHVECVYASDYDALAAKLTEVEVERDEAQNTLALADDQRREWEAHCKAAEADRDMISSAPRQYAYSLGVTAGQAMAACRAEAAESKLAKAVRLMELSVELATWNTTLLDDVINFTTELKGQNDA